MNVPKSHHLLTTQRGSHLFPFLADHTAPPRIDNLLSKPVALSFVSSHSSHTRETMVTPAAAASVRGMSGSTGREAVWTTQRS